MPSLAETERLILAARVRKAAGYDGITMEMLKLSPPRSARYLFPLFAKITTCLYEPVAFRGGALMVLAKKSWGCLPVQRFPVDSSGLFFFQAVPQMFAQPATHRLQLCYF